jgi:hypothetical protein
VNPYQFGADNDEALQSGAFWFYDRLGFRPIDGQVGELVERERARLATHPGSRSSMATLRRLARSDLVLELNPASAVPRFDEESLARIGGLVAADLAGVSSSCRDAHVRGLAHAHARVLGDVQRPLTAAEMRGARLLCPVIALMMSEAKAWAPEDRHALWELVHAKGAKRERRFAQLSRQHALFWRALTSRAARGTSWQSRRA